MAIKGKKKSQKRGGQARRRPTAPPRPAVQPRRKTGWYRTPTAIAILGVLAIIAIGVTVWVLQSNREDAEALEQTQNELTNYTDRVRTVLQSMRTPVGAMAAAPPALEDSATAEQLAEDAASWVKDLQKAQGTLAGIPPRPSVRGLHTLYTNAIEIYVSAARTYELAASTTDAKTQTEALTLATAQRTQAGAIWTEATAQLDRERQEAELDPSGLTAPDAAGATAPTVPTVPTVPPGDGGEGGGGGQGGGGQGGGGQGGGGQGGGGGGGGEKGAGSDGR